MSRQRARHICKVSRGGCHKRGEGTGGGGGGEEHSYTYVDEYYSRNEIQIVVSCFCSLRSFVLFLHY